MRNQEHQHRPTVIRSKLESWATTDYVCAFVLSCLVGMSLVLDARAEHATDRRTHGYDGWPETCKFQMKEYPCSSDADCNYCNNKRCSSTSSFCKDGVWDYGCWVGKNPNSWSGEFFDCEPVNKSRKEPDIFPVPCYRSGCFYSISATWTGTPRTSRLCDCNYELPAPTTTPMLTPKPVPASFPIKSPAQISPAPSSANKVINCNTMSIGGTYFLVSFIVGVLWLGILSGGTYAPKTRRRQRVANRNSVAQLHFQPSTLAMGTPRHALQPGLQAQMVFSSGAAQTAHPQPRVVSVPDPFPSPEECGPPCRQRSRCII